jgi:hypothetical protein
VIYKENIASTQKKKKQLYIRKHYQLNPQVNSNFKNINLIALRLHVNLENSLEYGFPSGGSLVVQPWQLIKDSFKA